MQKEVEVVQWQQLLEALPVEPHNVPYQKFRMTTRSGVRVKRYKAWVSISHILLMRQLPAVLGTVLRHNSKVQFYVEGINGDQPRVMTQAEAFL